MDLRSSVPSCMFILLISSIGLISSVPCSLRWPTNDGSLSDGRWSDRVSAFPPSSHAVSSLFLELSELESPPSFALSQSPPATHPQTIPFVLSWWTIRPVYVTPVHSTGTSSPASPAQAPQQAGRPRQDAASPPVESSGDHAGPVGWRAG